jgi:hypothetical protein
MWGSIITIHDGKYVRQLFKIHTVTYVTNFAISQEKMTRKMRDGFKMFPNRLYEDSRIGRSLPLLLAGVRKVLPLLALHDGNG